MSFALWGTVTHNINFDSAKPGDVPSGWTAVSDSGAPPKWEVLKDPSAPSPPYVFAQVPREVHANHCPLAILDEMEVKDGDLSVRVKPVGGKKDRDGGLVWRYRNPENYYLLRANARENTIILYKVEDGKRIPLMCRGTAPQGYGVKHAVPANQWSILKVQFRGSLFSVYFNHRRLFQVQDSTFAQAGKVGLWTISDSVTYFDDFRIAGK